MHFVSPVSQPRPLTPRLRREHRTIAAMLRLYCRAHHGGPVLCQDCQGLLDYAEGRLGTCPFQEDKPACNHCPVHCYSRTKRERVKAVMRYAGPRMLLRHPILALRHLLDARRPVPDWPRPKRAGGRE